MNYIIDFQIVQTLLLVVIFLSVLVEFKTGGTGIGALLGVIASVVFWAGGYTQGKVDFFEIAIFIVGIIFIIIEILTPTIGLLAGIGIVAIFYSFILAIGGDFMAIKILLMALILAIIIFCMILKRLPSSNLWQKIILTNASSTSEGFVSSEDYSMYLNKQGIVLTDLRPSGSIKVDEVVLDVISEGSFIDKGERVIVIKIEGGRIIVRKV